MTLATIFDVQRFSIHDGPGIRTVVFFKGCSLRCCWCQNPESLAHRPELAVYRERCIAADGCRDCIAACPRDAIALGELSVDRDRCDSCGACASLCPALALETIGRTVTVDELTAECLADREFYLASGGGVTLSGGEPVLQSTFLLQLLPRLKEQGLSLLLETAGNYPWRLLQPLIPLLDEVYYDWKLPDADSYAEHTGGSWERMTDNLARLVRAGVSFTVRMPVIAGFNTTADQVANAARALAHLGVTRLQLLPYNDLWRAKLPRLERRREPLPPLPSADPREVARAFRDLGIDARL